MATLTAMRPQQHDRFLARHEFGYRWHRYLRTWKGTIVISVINPLLFLIGIGVGLGRVVTTHPASLHGVTYLAFFAPGMLAAGGMQNGVVESAFPVSVSVGRAGSYRVAVTTPMDSNDILIGHLLFMTLRIAMSACAFVVVMLLFGAVKSPWIIAAIPAVTLTGLAFATPTAAWAATLESPRRIGALFKWVLMPLYLFSGTFFPISQLPLALRFLAQITPLWQGVALCRSLSLGTATLAGSLAHVGYLAAVGAIGIAIATRTYRRRLYG